MTRVPSAEVPAARRWRRPLLLALALNTVLVAGLGNVAVWWPLWSHFHVAPAAVAAAVLQQHRHEPGDDVLNTVAEASMMTDHPLHGEAAVTAARRLLLGELALPSFPVLAIDIGFDARDLDQGAPVQQLFMSSLLVPDLLLRAHAHTPDPAFLAAARTYMLRFIAHEARSQFPVSFVRNAHAVANRAATLARFWRLVRQTADPDEQTAREVHLHASRLMALLSKPSLFIGATNHGVMQNVALLQLTTAFPALAGADSARRLALERLDLQLPMYIGADGAVLEHAAGYHFHGVVLTGYVIRLLEAADRPVPAPWRAAHQAARRFLATLQRPDGTLPALGNTYRYAWKLPALVDSGFAHGQRPAGLPANFTQTFPLSGHAVWWDANTRAGAATQTVVPWGYFANHGHRHAQDLSLLIWSAGTDWSTNSGYWPGSDPKGAELASGWSGGNAPHVVGEAAGSLRRSVVLGQAAQGPLRLLDLERAVPGGPTVRRQVVQWQGSVWLAIDTYRDPARRPLRVLWTSAPETTQAIAADRVFRFEGKGSPVAMSLQVLGSAGVSAEPLIGSRDPFGGWVAFDRKAAPAPSVDARLPRPEGWMVTMLALTPEGSTPTQRAVVTRFNGPDDWEIRWPDATGDEVVMVRQGRMLNVQDNGQPATQVSVALAPGEDVSSALAEIERVDAAVAQAYPRFRTLEPERRKYSLALCALWLVLSVVAVLGHAWLGASRTDRHGQA